jgi:hypothetical protein
MKEMGGACGTYDKEKILIGNLRGTDQFEDLGVDGRIILICLFKKWGGGMDWIDLARIGSRGGIL